MLGVFGFSSGITTIAQSSPTLSVNPNFYQAESLGETVPIQVYVFAVSNVTGYQFQLRFNTTQLHCLSATVGNWFPGPPNSTSTVTVDNNQGRVSIQAYLQGGSPPLSVFGTFHGNLLNVSFNATYAPAYPRPDNNSPLTLANDVLYGIGNQTIPHTVQNGLYVTPYTPPQLDLTLNTNKNNYFYEDKINISGTFTGNGYPIPDALVALEIQAPNGSPIVARTFELSNYSILPPVKIVTLRPCSLGGDPQDSFQVGNLVYFNVTVQNVGHDSLTALVLVNPYDSSNASLGVSHFWTYLPAGSSNSMLSEFLLPYNYDPRVLTSATSGNAAVYASVWTNHIANGGSPLALERSANFTITGSAQGIPTLTNEPPIGTYQDVWSRHFAKGIYSLSQPPNYTVSVEAQFMGSGWTQNTVQNKSKQIQITIGGDINKDGKANLQDLATLAKAYGTKPGDAKWNPAADINGDGKVNLMDLAILAKNYGKGTV
jgi:hypothetical protein